MERTKIYGFLFLASPCTRLCDGPQIGAQVTFINGEQSWERRLIVAVGHTVGVLNEASDVSNCLKNTVATGVVHGGVSLYSALTFTDT